MFMEFHLHNRIMLNYIPGIILHYNNKFFYINVILLCKWYCLHYNI